MADDQPAPDLDFVRERLAVAADRARHPLTPTPVRRAIRQARAELDPGLPADVDQCPACGRIGLAERVAAHDCPDHPARTER